MIYNENWCVRQEYTQNVGAYFVKWFLKRGKNKKENTGKKLWLDLFKKGLLFAKYLIHVIENE